MIGRNMHRAWLIVSMAAVLCGSMGCFKWPEGEFGSKEPDVALFERAMFALGRDRFDVANMTLQTLVNTYPDSDYARKAAVLLQDPRIANCGSSWNSFSECNSRLAAAPSSED
jgi:hypothetical protein